MIDKSYTIHYAIVAVAHWQSGLGQQQQGLHRFENTMAWESAVGGAIARASRNTNSGGEETAIREQIKEPLLLTTVVQMLNRCSVPKTGRTSFSDALFWFFFGQAKKNKEYSGIPKEAKQLKLIGPS
ncbi:MAG: hypothetical protein JST58_09595 [Bacteroidetes bacterium]|nr:hypothetical protein [Bacteroidota bacterium]